MKCVPNDVPIPAGGGKRAFVSIVTSETAFLPDDLKNQIPDERELEAEVERRATAFTAVLARIIETPAAPRHWGLNE